MQQKERVERLREALVVERPSALTQDPYDGDIETLRRLRDRQPLAGDWDRYAEAALYGRTFQSELFAYLLPDLLEEWERTLSTGAFADHVPNVLIQCLPTVFGHEGAPAVSEYLAETTLARFDDVISLACPDRMSALPTYDWQQVWATAALVSGSMDILLPLWTSFSTQGRALALAQFASCLLYRDDANPLFRRWTPEDGGGPPQLWEAAGYGSNGWESSNLEALDRHLAPVRLTELLTLALARVSAADRARAEQILNDLPTNRSRMELRWPVLLHLLAEPDSDLAEVWNE